MRRAASRPAREAVCRSTRRCARVSLSAVRERQHLASGAQPLEPRKRLFDVHSSGRFQGDRARIAVAECRVKLRQAVNQLKIIGRHQRRTHQAQTLDSLPVEGHAAGGLDPVAVQIPTRDELLAVTGKRPSRAILTGRQPGRSRQPLKPGRCPGRIRATGGDDRFQHRPLVLKPRVDRCLDLVMATRPAIQEHRWNPFKLEIPPTTASAALDPKPQL